MGISPSVHGFVVVIGPENNLNYFTGCGYNAHLNDAKVFRTSRGALCAAYIWQHADYNGQPLPPSRWKERRTVPVSLRLA